MMSSGIFPFYLGQKLAKFRGCTPSKQIEARLKPTEKKAFKSPLELFIYARKQCKFQLLLFGLN